MTLSLLGISRYHETTLQVALSRYYLHFILATKLLAAVRNLSPIQPHVVTKSVTPMHPNLKRIVSPHPAVLQQLATPPNRFPIFMTQ